VKALAFVAVVCIMCGCLGSQPAATTTSIAAGAGCQGLGSQRAADDCYLKRAKDARDISSCALINDSVTRSGCEININLELALRTTTTSTTTIPTASSAAPTTTTAADAPEISTSTTAPQPKAQAETIIDCIRRRSAYDPDGTFYMYGQGCGSKYLSDVSIVSRQTGIYITPLIVQTAGEESDIRVLECFFGPYTAEGKEFVDCPKILCPRTGESDGLGDTTSNSIKAQITKLVKKCIESEDPPATVPTAEEAAAAQAKAIVPEPDTPQEPAQCSSTNPKMDYYVRGTTYGRNGNRTDLCVISQKYPDHDRVRKYFCAPDGSVASVEYMCPVICQEGACMRNIVH
jgi:hypothetical protein